MCKISEVISASSITLTVIQNRRPVAFYKVIWREKNLTKCSAVIILVHAPESSSGEMTLENLPLTAHLLWHQEISHGSNSSVLWLYTSIHNYM